MSQSHATAVVKDSKAKPVSQGTADARSQAKGSARTAEELFQQAADLIEKDQYSKAIALLRRATSLAPSDARVHHYLGYALWKERQWSSATKEFEDALKLDPGNLYTRYFLGRIAYAEGATNRAIGFFEAVVAAGEPVHDTYQRLGQAYMRRGDFPKALEMMQQAVSQTPWDGAIHYQLAKIYRQMGRPQEAQREFETSERLKQTDQDSIKTLLEISEAIHKKQKDEVLRLRGELLSRPSHDPEILNWLGTLLGQGGFYAEAVQPLQGAAEANPSSFEAQYNLGLTQLKLGNNAEAESRLRKALELRPDSFEANSILAVLYVSQNRNREAIVKLRVADHVRPGNPRALALLGQQYLQGYYITEAVKTLEPATRLKPNDSDLRYLLIEAYQKNSEYEKAFKAAQETARLFPGEARAQYEVGHQMANLGRYQDARPYFEKAAGLDPSFTEAHNGLGDAELRKGNYEAALESFMRARALDSRNLAALRGIGQCLIRLKRYPEALDHLEKAIALQPEDAELYFEFSQLQARLGNREKAAQAAATFERLRATEIEKRAMERPRAFQAGARAEVQPK